MLGGVAKRYLRGNHKCTGDEREEHVQLDKIILAFMEAGGFVKHQKGPNTTSSRYLHLE